MTVAFDTLTNNATSTLAGGAGGAGTTFASGDLSFTLHAGDGNGKPFPSGACMILFGSLSSTYEFVHCTSRTGDTVTCTRAAEDSSTHPAQNWTVGTPVQVVFTAGHISAIWSAMNRGRVYNVLDYGAVGDGTTDDSPGIQAAIDASLAGSRIYFPYTGNKYQIHTMLKFKSGRAYYGDQDETWLQMANGTNLTAIAATEEWANDVTLTGNPMFIENLGFDGNDANNTAANGGHGFILDAWQSVMRQCWVKHTPGSGIVIADRTYTGMILAGGPTYNVTNSVVENKLYDIKMANTDSHGIWGTDFNGQITDGRIENVDINTTAVDMVGIKLDRGAGWYLENNHLYSIKGSGYTVNKCFATFFRGNQIADFGNDATCASSYSGIGLTCIEGYPTICSDNIIVNHQASTAASYTSLSITMDGFLTATYGTYIIIHSNQIRGAYNTVISALCLGLNISASSQQQTSAQPAGVLAYANHFDRIQTESSVGSYIVSNWLTFRVRGPSQLDGDLSFGDHLLSTSSGGMTITAGASAGTTPPNPVITAGHDTRGRVTFGTGTGPSSGVMVHVAFNKAYVITVPSVMVVAENDATSALQLSVVPTLNGFDLRAGVAPAASQANTVYAFAWHVIG